MHRQNIPYLGGLPADRQDRAPSDDVHYPGDRGAVPGQPGRTPSGAARWVNRYTATNFPFVIGTESEQIIPANPLRAYLLVQNKDAGSDMFLNFGQKANAFNGVIIVPRGNFELIGGSIGGPFVPSDSVWIVGAAAVMEGVLIEGVLPT